MEYMNGKGAIQLVRNYIESEMSEYMRIDDILNNNNIPHEIIQCSINEIDSYEDRSDVIVSSTQLQGEYSIPTVMGIGFISGIGAEEAERQLLEILRT